MSLLASIGSILVSIVLLALLCVDFLKYADSIRGTTSEKWRDVINGSYGHIAHRYWDILETMINDSLDPKRDLLYQVFQAHIEEAQKKKPVFAVPERLLKEADHLRSAMRKFLFPKVLLSHLSILAIMIGMIMANGDPINWAGWICDGLLALAVIVCLAFWVVAWAYQNRLHDFPQHTQNLTNHFFRLLGDTSKPPDPH
jgi:hypothetical protein